MAIYRCEVKNISRGQGRSCVAAAAYRSASELVDERQGMTHSYARKEGVEHAEIVAPDGAPSWALDRQALWNAADAAEKRKDARTAKEVLVALPRELSLPQQIELVKEFARAEFASKGLVADIAIHAPDALDGEKQPHAHIMLTTRALEGQGFAKGKDKSLDQPDGIEAIRERWASHANRALERAGLGERVDHRSLERQRAEARAQGDDLRAAVLDRPPEPKIGPVAMQMVRAGRAEQARAWKDVRGLRQDRVLLHQLAGQVIDMAKAARELVQQQAQRLAALGGRLEAAMQAAKERVGAALGATQAPAPAEADKATAAEWKRLVEARTADLRERAEARLAEARDGLSAADRQLDAHAKQQPAEPRGLGAFVPGTTARYQQARRDWHETHEGLRQSRNAHLTRQRQLEAFLGRGDGYTKVAETLHQRVAREVREEHPELAKRMDTERERQEAVRRGEVEQHRQQALERFTQQRQKERDNNRGRGGRGR